MDDQEESVEPTVNKRLAPSALKRKLVHNSNLVPPATTTSAQQTVDEEHPADDPILPSDLEDPDEFLLVDKYNRTIIEPYGSDFQPQRAATNALTTIIHQNYQQPWLTWGEIKAAKVGDVPVWKRFFNAFKNLCTWDKRREGEVIKIFDTKCSKKLSSFLRDARNGYHDGKGPPGWIGPGTTWTELCRKWDEPDYVKKCKRNKQNRAQMPEASIHTGGSTSSGTMRIRFFKKYGRVPTLCDMNEMLHKRKDGTWDNVKAKRANDLIKVYIAELKATEAALPPSQRKSEDVIHNMIIDKFVEFSGGKHHGRIVGLGSTSSFIQRTPAGFIDTSSDSLGSTASIATSRNQSGETFEEMEARLTAKQDRLIAKHDRDMQEMEARLRAEFQSGSSGNQSRQQAEEEDEYRPDINVPVNRPSTEPDDLFNGLQNEPLLQELLGDGDDLHISGFSNAEFQNMGSWNQGGGNQNSQGGWNQNSQGGWNQNAQGGWNQNSQGGGNPSVQSGGHPNFQGDANFQGNGNPFFQGGGYVQGGLNFQSNGNFQGNGYVQAGVNFQSAQNGQGGGRNEFPMSGGRNQNMMNNGSAGRTNGGRSSGGRTRGRNS